MHSQAREWLVIVEHREASALDGACFEYVIVAPTKKSAEKRARKKHDSQNTASNVVATVESPLPTNVPSTKQADEYESRTRIA